MRNKALSEIKRSHSVLKFGDNWLVVRVVKSNGDFEFKVLDSFLSKSQAWKKLCAVYKNQ